MVGVPGLPVQSPSLRPLDPTPEGGPFLRPHPCDRRGSYFGTKDGLRVLCDSDTGLLLPTSPNSDNWTRHRGGYRSPVTLPHGTRTDVPVTRTHNPRLLRMRNGVGVCQGIDGTPDFKERNRGHLKSLPCCGPLRFFCFPFSWFRKTLVLYRRTTLPTRGPHRCPSPVRGGAWVEDRGREGGILTPRGSSRDGVRDKHPSTSSPPPVRIPKEPFLGNGVVPYPCKGVVVAPRSRNNSSPLYTN